MERVDGLRGLVVSSAGRRPPGGPHRHDRQRDVAGVRGRRFGPRDRVREVVDRDPGSARDDHGPPALNSTVGLNLEEVFFLADRPRSAAEPERYPGGLHVAQKQINDLGRRAIAEQLAQLHQVLQDLREVIGSAANEPATGEDLSLAS